MLKKITEHHPEEKNSFIANHFHEFYDNIVITFS
jgi:hypothetical protein